MVEIEYQEDGMRVRIHRDPPLEEQEQMISPEENSRFTREFIERINEKRRQRMEGS